ncbi:MULTISPECIES: hypothetical protein [unclassified Fusibacter]|uniref:hypothetical protein n=1 Tax=unclassified Fusibacter TaxID=2624464 RepID=UPI001010CC93|nr:MULTISPECIES: hypothetical protein [unclassified Fusibacter]MCK8059848.1 hypothetical protein [Fusibacter sp. A2]NPE21650.1 hypothetical protein [Fusibacter sp. A1]RXV62054.1 hypothetical protein DWB64_07385 [Fusibacter sp. A1]
MRVKHCFMTKTRLMGVVAGYIVYEMDEVEIAEFYHIEFEEYGIDRFEKLENPSEFQMKQMKLEIFGGLGGPLVELSEPMFRQVLLAGHLVNKESEDHEMAYCESPWYRQKTGFDSETFKEGILLVTENLRSPHELIHYFLMRYVGIDLIYLRYCTNQYNFLDKRYSLLRNHIEKIEGEKYSFSALLLEESYTIIEGEIMLDDGVVVDFEIKAQLKISDLEAALMLRKTEYIYLYDVDTELVEQMLVLEHKYLATTLYPHGRLYTCYHANNNHVNKRTFYLSGDVEAYFYFTDSDQLLLASSDLKAMLKWDDKLTSRFGGDIEKYEEWDFEESILYDFIDSDFVDFDDFLAYQD